MSEEKKQEQEFDPSTMMLQFYDNWTKSWAKAMSDTVASKTFAESMGKQMESSLDAMGMVRRQVSEMMEQYLQQMSMPTRSEVLSLGERLTKIEMTIDDLDAKLDEVLDQLKATRGKK